MENIKLEVGKYYKTRGGRKAEIVGISQSKIFYTHVGVIDGENEGFSWMPNGTNQAVKESDNDLIAEWKEPKRIKGWLNVYPDHCVYLYPTREVADAGIGGKFGADLRVACTEIDVVEGHGLDGSTR